MAKRQKRFSGTDLLSSEIIGKEVSLIKRDGSVFHIKITKSDLNHIAGEDLGKKSYNFPLKEVYEIILDLVAAY